jgi:hypothetical protein
VTAGLTSTCLLTEINGHSANSGVMCGQHVTFPAMVFSRLGLSPQISSYPNSSQFWDGTDPKHWPKILLPQRIEPAHLIVQVQSTMP